MPIVKQTTTTRTSYSMDIDATELIIALQAAGHKIPPGADVSFLVPGGGDWSNTSVEVNANHPVTVSWTVQEKDNG